MPCLRRITRSRLRRRPERSSRRLAPASRGDVQRPCSPRATATRPLARAAPRHPFLDPGRGAPRGAARAAVDRLTELDPARLRRLQRVGTLWGTLLFNELRDAGSARWLGVLGGAVLMFTGATLLAVASSAHAPGGNALRGVAAALAAGALWGTMYIPYRKAYLTGMHPLS